MEQYLIDEYSVIEDINWLTDENDIESYFKDNSGDLFECGQGYYQEEVDIICKIGDKFYNVNIVAEIGSSKQDRGDRLYWVDDIKCVTYKQIDKPQPKERKYVIYKIHVTEDEERVIKNFMNENRMRYEKY